MQFLTNAVLETRVPQTNLLQRAAEVEISKKVQLIQIVSRAITIGNEDVDATLRGFKLIGVNLNDLLMYMLA